MNGGKRHLWGTGILLIVWTTLGLQVAGAADTKQRIQPWKVNLRYWQYKGEPVLLLGGTGQDNPFNHPEALPPDGLESHLDLLAASGGNYIRNTMSHRDAGNVFAYAREDDGRLDLDQWNPEYWRRLGNLLRWAVERDIIVQIEVWEPRDFHRSGGSGVSGSQIGWKHNPSQITKWRRQMLEQALDLFSDRSKRDRQDDEDIRAQLYQQIGRLKVELDWLKKIWVRRLRASA